MSDMTGGVNPIANKQAAAMSGGKRRRHRPPVVRERRPRAPCRKKTRLVDDGEQYDGSFQGDNFEILEVMRRCEDDGRGTGQREVSLREMPRVQVDSDDLNADADRGEVENGVVWNPCQEYECERIGWGDIDTEQEDRLLLRSAAEVFQWRLKFQEWMTDLGRLINDV